MGRDKLSGSKGGVNFLGPGEGKTFWVQVWGKLSGSRGGVNFLDTGVGKTFWVQGWGKLSGSRSWGKLSGSRAWGNLYLWAGFGRKTSYRQGVGTIFCGQGGFLQSNFRSFFWPDSLFVGRVWEDNFI